MEDQTCPRRMAEFGPWSKVRGMDGFGPDQCCKFCGSLDPKVLMERLEAKTVQLVPTDKTYKVYVRNAGGPDFQQRVRIDNAYRHPDPAYRMDERNWVYELRPTSQVKLYFKHLSEAQMRRIIELVNTQQVQFAYPGYFYVRPYFIKYE